MTSDAPPVTPERAGPATLATDAAMLPARLRTGRALCTPVWTLRTKVAKLGIVGYKAWRDIIGMETWISIAGAPQYSVSSLGRVMSFKRRRPRLLNGGVNGNGYREIAINGRKMSLARLVAMAFLQNPEGLAEVDHVDRNKLNNRLDNLRWASRTTNMLNRRTWGDCCYRGVTYHKQSRKYLAQISHQGAMVHLGSYDSPEEAASVFDFHARELRGAGAFVNFE